MASVFGKCAAHTRTRLRRLGREYLRCGSTPFHVPNKSYALRGRVQQRILAGKTSSKFGEAVCSKEHSIKDQKREILDEKRNLKSR